MIENNLHCHIRYWAEMNHIGDSWNQRDRSVRNLLNHKVWSAESGESPPSRAIIGGNVGGKRAMSEYMYLILEPVAKGMERMEINATRGLLSVIEKLNE